MLLLNRSPLFSNSSCSSSSSCMFAHDTRSSANSIAWGGPLPTSFDITSITVMNSNGLSDLDVDQLSPQSSPLILLAFFTDVVGPTSIVHIQYHFNVFFSNIFLPYCPPYNISWFSIIRFFEIYKDHNVDFVFFPNAFLVSFLVRRLALLW